MQPPAGRAAQRLARAGGAIYLFVIVAAAFGEVAVRGNLVVVGDAQATAQAILNHESLFRTGLIAELLTCAADVALAAIFYALLARVDRTIALLGAFFRLAFVAVYGCAKLFELATLIALKQAVLNDALDSTATQALAYAALALHDASYGVSLLFFGFCCLCFGRLIRKSGFLPPLAGRALSIAGACYVLFSLAQVASPARAAAALFPWLLLPCFFAELGLAGWMLAKGIDVPAWENAPRS